MSGNGSFDLAAFGQKIVPVLSLPQHNRRVTPCPWDAELRQGITGVYNEESVLIRCAAAVGGTMRTSACGRFEFDD